MADGSRKAVRLIIFACVSLVVGAAVFYVMMMPQFNKDAYDRDYFGLTLNNADYAMMKSDTRDDAEKRGIDRILARLNDQLTAKDLESMGVKAFQPVTFKTMSGRAINGIFMPAKNAKHTVLAIPNRFGVMYVPVLTGHAKLMTDAGCSVLLFDYTGKGKNPGHATLENACEDVEAAYDYLLNARKIPATSIIVYAPCQLSAYLAQDLLAKHACAAVVLEGEIAKTQTEICALLPWMSFLPSSFYGRYALDITPFLAGKHPPLLIAYPAEGCLQRLGIGGSGAVAIASEPKEIATIETYGNSWFPYLDRCPQYVSQLEKFLQSH